MILGIDTATAVASVALVEDGRLVSEEARSASPRQSPTGRSDHAEMLLPLIGSVLNKAGLSLTGISALALSVGPGSFTGLRIGLSTVKGLAYGWDVAVLGVPTLLAMAARATDWEGVICPFLDARKKEVYAALFRSTGGALERLIEDVVSPAASVIEKAKALGGAERWLFIGDGVQVYGDLITTALGGRALLTLGEAYPSTACAVARLAEDRLRKKEADPVGTMIPIYLRPSEAEVKRGL